MNSTTATGFSRRDFLKGAAASTLGVAALSAMSGSSLSLAFADEAAIYTPGTYVGEGTGISSTVTVTITVDETSITAVEVDASGETASIGAAAADTLAQQVLEAQSADIDGVSGATVTSNAVRTAAAAALEQAAAGSAEEEAAEETASADGRVSGYCGPGDWLGEAPVISEDEIVATYDVDVVVLGGGHAGLMATLGAVDEGCTVATIEQQAWSAFVDLEGTGANMGGWYGEDIGHVNSDILIERGFGPYNTGEITTEFCKRGGGRVNPDIVRAFVQNSGAMVNRYKEVYDLYEEERLENDSSVYLTSTQVVIDGVAVDDEGYFDMSNMFEYPIEAGGYKTWPCNIQFYGYQGNNIEYVHKYIVQYTQENGATWYYEHTGVVLVQDDDGAVTGLIATNADGEYVQFNAAKGVILASGDFIGNPDMCWALLNEGMEWAERAGSTSSDWTSSGSRAGAGHKMGVWAGGMIEPTPRGWMGLGGGASGPWGTAPLYMCNVDGKRFCNEASIAQLTPVCLRQPAGLCAWVTDANWKTTVGAAPLDHGAPNFGMDDYMVQLEAGMEAVEIGNSEGTFVIGANLAERKMMGGTVYGAETLDELADMLGYADEAKENFLASIEAYNELCYSEDGDTDYGKDAKYMVPIDTPPYYGGTGSLSHRSSPSMVTMSGLMTDGTQNVLNTDWEGIPGLYAAGNVLGGRYGMGYSTPFAGNSVGMAMTHGWVAGHTVGQL